MKILYITDNIKLDSGIGRYSFSVISHLLSMNIDCTVLTKKNKSSGHEKEKPLLHQSISIFGLVKNIFLIKRELRSHDMVHALDCWPYGVCAHIASIRTGKSVFINGVGTYSIPFGNKFKIFLMKQAYIHAKKVFCISEYVKKQIIKIVPMADAEVVFLGTTKLPVLSEKEKGLYENKYNFNKNNPILLTVGGVKDRKGQLDTLKSVRRIKTQYPDVLYLIVGSCADKTYIKKILSYIKANNLKDNVRILPNVRTDEELAYMYSLCDVFLLNSNNNGVHFEGFGLVLLEAAQLGKPVIGSNGCGIEDAIENGYNGYLANQRDHEDIYQKLLLVLREKSALFGENSLEFSKKFTWRKTVSSYVKSYYFFK